MTADTTAPQPETATPRRRTLYTGYHVYRADEPFTVDQDVYEASFDADGVNALDPTLYVDDLNARKAAEADYKRRVSAPGELRWTPIRHGWRLETVTGEDTGVRIGLAMSSKPHVTFEGPEDAPDGQATT